MNTKETSNKEQAEKNMHSDHSTPCAALKELDIRVLQKLDEVIDSQAVILHMQEEMNEVLIAWNNTKGFVKTVILISKTLKWIVGTGAAIATIWYFMVRR